jgi:dephospho-CoA kinase
MIIGITGGIGSGKSAVTKAFPRSFKVFDVDKVSNSYYKKSSVIREMESRYGPLGVDPKATMREIVKARPEVLNELRDYFSVLVGRDLAKAIRKGNWIVDFPLLFETGWDKKCDMVIAVTAPMFLRERRVWRRSKMPRELFYSIVGQQMLDWERVKKANVHFHNGLGRGRIVAFVRRIVYG